MVSKSRWSRWSKRLTYLECTTNMNTTMQTRMKMEHLSNEIFRWLQAGRHRNFCRKWRNSCGSVRPWFHLNPSNIVLKETFKASRAKGKTTGYSVKLWHMWRRPCVKKLRVTLSQTWQLNQFICTVPTMIWMSASMIRFVYIRPSH